METITGRLGDMLSRRPVFLRCQLRSPRSHEISTGGCRRSASRHAAPPASQWGHRHPARRDLHSGLSRSSPALARCFGTAV